VSSDGGVKQVNGIAVDFYGGVKPVNGIAVDFYGGVKPVNGIAVDFYDCKIYIQHCLSIYNVRTMDKENKISHLLQLCAIINGFFGIILRRVKTKR
jgi:hypothetical protein